MKLCAYMCVQQKYSSTYRAWILVPVKLQIDVVLIKKEKQWLWYHSANFILYTQFGLSKNQTRLPLAPTPIPPVRL